MAGCKDMCLRYKAKKNRSGARYANGQKRCQMCEIFIEGEGLWCPCCGFKLRTKPRNTRLRQKLRQMLSASNQEE